MRAVLLLLITLGICCAFGFAEQAYAKRGKGSSTLTVVVVPFVGKGAGGENVKEALELELELVATVRLLASDSLERDLSNAGKRAFDKQKLSSVLKRAGIDVLIRGERGAGANNPDALLVTAYGKDGQPRFFRELALGSDPDAVAVTIIDALRPLLERWQGARPVRVPVAADEDEPLDVFVGDDDADQDKDSARLIRRPTRDPVDRSAPVEQQRPRKESRLDEEPSEEEVDPVKSIDDVEDELASPTATKLSHTLALSGAFDGGTWRYTFDGNGVGDTNLVAPFYVGGSALIDVWPVPWLGADLELAFAGVPFVIGGPIPVVPASFISVQSRVGAALKLRYAMQNGVGIGGRLGYRYYGASVETQTILSGTTLETLTVVPGYTLHALALGVELFVPIIIGGKRLEIDLRADALPGLSFYQEQPDNPGGKTLAYGWSLLLAARYDLAAGFFLEARGQSTGASVTYTQEGERQAFVGPTLQNLQGGTVLNLVLGFSTGIGFMF